MEYRNPFLSESILCHYVDLPNTSYVSNSFVNKYGYHDPKKEAQLRFDNAKSGSGMTFGGAKVKTAILLFIFSISYTLSWFASQAKVFDYHWSILPAILATALFFVLWMVNRPEHSSFLSPSACLLFGVFLGGIFLRDLERAYSML